MKKRSIKKINKDSFLYKIFPDFHIELFSIMYLMLFFNTIIDKSFGEFTNYIWGIMWSNVFTTIFSWTVVIAIFYTVIFTFSKSSPIPQGAPNDKSLKNLTKLIVFYGGLVYLLISTSSIIYIFISGQQFNWKIIFASFFNFVNLVYGLTAIILLLLPILTQLLLIIRDFIKMMSTNQKVPFKIYKVMILPLDKKLIDLNTNRIIIIIFILISFFLLYIGKFFLGYNSIINLSFSLFWINLFFNLYLKSKKSFFAS